jgi:uncharacterized protein (TIGR03437 family)
MQRAGWLVLLGLGLGVAHSQSYLYFTFDPPGSTYTLVSGMNNSGQMVGMYQDSAGWHSFLRSSDGVTYTTISVPGASQTNATGINNLGQVVGSYTDGSGWHAFLRAVDGAFTTFDAPEAFPYTQPAAINDRGEIVGTKLSAGPVTDGFLRSADGSTYATISAPGASATFVQGIANDGEIVGWYVVGGSYGPQRGFARRVDGSYTAIEVPGTTGATHVLAINNRGQVAGSSSGSGFVRNADGTFVYLDKSPVAINDNGQVAGNYSDTGGYHGFLAVPASGGTSPLIRPNGVITASAFGGSNAIAPGTFIEIYGQNLSGTTRSWQASDFTANTAPKSLDGVSVRVNGQPAYVSYVSPGQVNALVPSAIAPGTAVVTVQNGSQIGNPCTVTVNALEPGLLAFPPTTSAADLYVVAIFPDYTTYALPPGTGLPVPSRRAKAGDTVTLYGIGFGPVIPDVSAGNIATQANSLQASVSVWFDGHPGRVTYAGSAPGFVGLYQLNVVVPDGVVVAGTVDDAVLVTVVLNGNIFRPAGALHLFTALQG